MIVLIMIAVGALLGLVASEAWLMNMLLGETRWLAVATGGAVGGLWGMVLRQSERIGRLERHLKEHAVSGESRTKAAEAPAATDAPARAGRTDTPAATPPLRTPQRPAAATRQDDWQDTSQGAIQGNRQDSRHDNHYDNHYDSRQDSRKDHRQPPSVVWLRLRGWFIEGNVPVKIGILVSFIGVAALLRYVNEQGWLTAPIEVRLLAVAAAAIGALIFGWRQRTDRRVFALSLQGGAIGVLLLTIFAAFRLYQVLPSEAAFGLMVILVAAGGVLAVAQSAAGLAVLTMLAGFAAPLLISTGDGNHIALFSWYAVLNLAVFAVAWRQHWPLLNRVGFLFTFVVGAAWGVLSWSPEHYVSAQAFLLLFFTLYLLIPMLEARRSDSRSAPALDVILVFGLPLFAVPLQIGLLQGDRIAIAFSAVYGALIYLFGAALILRRWRIRSLGQSHAVLAIGLATLAVPFAFSGPTITFIWAAEGAALVWFGCIQGRRLTRLSGLALQLAAVGVWLVAHALSGHSPGPILVNSIFLGGMALVVAGAVTAWQYHLAGATLWRVNLIAAWTLSIWVIAGVMELTAQLPGHRLAQGLTAFWALTALLAALAHRRFVWPVTGFASAAAFILCALHAFELIFDGPLPGLNLAVWLSVIASALLSDHLLLKAGTRWRFWTTLAAHLAVFTTLALAGIHLATESWQLGTGWSWLAGALPALVLVSWLLSQRRPPLCADTLPGDAYAGLTAATLLVLGLGLTASLFSPGQSAPLPWLAVINPLELGQIIALLLLVVACRLKAPPFLPLPGIIPAAAALVVLTIMVLRSVHHVAGLDWELAALLQSQYSQAALSLLWSALGVIAWVIGSRRRIPALWWAGAMLLGLVLVKLLLVDRQFLSNMAGILSFLAFGMLSMLVGYLAPAPPSTRPERENPA